MKRKKKTFTAEELIKMRKNNEYVKRWRENNKEKYNEYMRNYMREYNAKKREQERKQNILQKFLKLLRR